MLHKTSDGNLYYRIIDCVPPWKGNPDTIIFCHGIATNCDIWLDWLPSLISKFKIIMFDTRGFGRSTIFMSDPDWTFDKLAEDIISIADLANAENFHLVGESAGGTASLFLASSGSQRIKSLTCVSTAHYGNNLPFVKNWRDEIIKDGMNNWSLEMMEHRFFMNQLDPKKRDWYFKEQSKTNINSILGIGDLLLNSNLSDRLGKIKIPVLLLVPDSSPFVTVRLATELREIVSTSEMRVFPYSKHGLPFSHGKECAEAMNEFIERHFQ